MLRCAAGRPCDQGPVGCRAQARTGLADSLRRSDTAELTRSLRVRGAASASRPSRRCAGRAQALLQAGDQRA